jgi:hypothetical protein
VKLGLLMAILALQIVTLTTMLIWTARIYRAVHGWE